MRKFYFITFLILILLLIMCNSSECASFDFVAGPNSLNAYKTFEMYIPNDVLELFHDSPYYSEDYYYLMYYRVMDGTPYYVWRFYAVSKADYPDFSFGYDASNGIVTFPQYNPPFHYMYATWGTDTALPSSLTWSLQTTGGTNRTVYSQGDTIYLWSNYDSFALTWGGSTVRQHFPDEPVNFVAPEIYPNADADTTALTTGNFTFFIVEPGSVPSSSTMTLKVYNTSSSYNSSSPVATYTLNENSAFFQYTDTNNTSYHYILTARFLDWYKVLNGNSYRFELTYNDRSFTSYTITYNWTISLTSAQQQAITESTQQDISQDISSIEGFLKASIGDQFNYNLPSYSINDTTFLGQITTIFDYLKDIFTTEYPINFVFTLPNSNYTITIPSDYISSHLPVSIIYLVQTFYWYLICRFIIKDIAKLFDKLRQGDYFTASEHNIKTEVL